MHHRPLFLFVSSAVFALSFSFVGPARAEVFLDPMFDVNVTSDIVYGTGQIGHPDNLRDMDLKLDLYQPTGAGLPELLPGIVLIHGGGFSAGEKGNMSELATEFASRGYVATSIQYRLFGRDFFSHPPPAPYIVEGQNPLRTAAIYAALVDSAKGVNWLRDAGGDLNIDTDRIVVGGNSAGAIVSLVVGMAHNSSDTLLPGAEVAGVLAMSGSGLVSLVDSADPATYIVNGRQDAAHIRNIDLAAALTAAGVPVGFPQFDGFHEFEPLLRTDLGNGHLVSDDMYDFFYDQLELQALAVPEPSSITLLAGLAAIGLFAAGGRSVF